MTDWDPDDYLRFADYRTRPAVELASRTRVARPARVVDLGCGPGNSTQVLRDRWTDADVSGLDSSPAMIAAARQRYPGREWVTGDIGEWTSDEPVDVVFSNAALQWVPDHARVVPHLFRQVAAGGALAFQLPSREDRSVQALIDEIADDAGWVSWMAAARSALTIEEPCVYYDLLAPLACGVDLWETIYHQVMESPAAIVEWISSTGLRPYLDSLDSDERRRRFAALLAERVAASYPRRGDGRVLLPFRRTFVIAYA